MTYSVNWVTKRVTIPLADLTFVSGVNYTLNAGDVAAELRRLEWEFVDGLWALQVARWTDTKILSGIPYSAALELINGYTWDINASNIIVSLLGINNNLLDTFVPANGVSVLANNSAGKIDADLSQTSVSAVAGAVWDEKTSDHKILATYGADVATKSDVQESKSTEYYTKTSASIIAGVDVIGSATDIDLRDGTYWQVDEDGTTGLTMEYVFNLTTAEEKSGVFTFFGRYTGAPNSHYIELWAWNVGAAAWELMHERFVDNSNSDLEALHAYEERHIDKALSNKVIMRMVHNVVNYSATHELHIDSVALSSISTSPGVGFTDADRTKLGETYDQSFIGASNTQP